MASARWLVVATLLATPLACAGKHLDVGNDAQGSGGTGGSPTQGGGTSSDSGAAPGRLLASGGNLSGGAVCPDTPVAQGQSCQNELLGCSYQMDDTVNQGRFSNHECMCVEWAANDLRWDCGYNAQQYDPSCPAALPENGASCFGHYGTICAYPLGNQCNCNTFDDTSGNWSCDTLQRQGLPALPATLDPGTPLNQLTDAERGAWCQWFQDAEVGPGAPPIQDGLVGPEGKTLNTGCSFGEPPTAHVAVPTLGPTQCAQNLALTTCAAPVSELTDCVTTVFNQGVPAPHGCPRYVAQPGCDGTMVTGFNASGGGGGVPGFSGCGVRVQ